MVALKERDLSKIEVSRWGVKPYTGKIQDKDVYGWDTETYDGKVTLISVVGKNYKESLMTTDIDKILEFLCHKRFNGSHNFFFNLRYDRDAIIKMLPQERINELKLNDNTFYKQYRIQLIGNKVFKISRWKISYYIDTGKRKKKIKKTEIEEYPQDEIETKIENNLTSFFSDIATFYHLGSLENTVKKGLKLLYKKGVKIGRGVYFQDQVAYVKRSRSDKHDRYSYIDIVKYCEQDSYYTYLLGKNVVDMVKELKIPVPNFYSPASISKGFLRMQLREGYEFKKSVITQMALDSYNGGRFEVFSRGFYDKVHMADLCSCYPYEISKLYEPKGKYVQNNEYEPESLYSFFKCDIRINNDFRMSPFKFTVKNLNELLVFPTGTFRDVTITKKEYEILEKMDCRVKINKAIHLFNREPRLWVEGIEEIYRKRQEYKKLNNRLEHILKLILNSLYGITIQLNRISKLPVQLDDENKLKDERNEFIEIVENNEVYYLLVESLWKAGAWFNPILATEITGGARCRLFEDLHKYEEHILQIATDSVAMSRPIPFKHSKELGGWEHYNLMEGFLIGNGIYHFQEKKTGKICEKRRGLISDHKIDLNALINYGGNIYQNFFEGAYLDSVSFRKTRPKGLKEGLPKMYQQYNANELINIFLPYERELSINLDRKRVWERDFGSLHDIRHNQIDSIPLEFENGKIQNN